MNILFPTQYVSRMEDYDFDAAYKSGKRLILFDIDNTLVRHDAPADKRAVRFTSKLKNMGFKLCCVSNNSRERVEPFAVATGSSFVYHAHKPSPKGFKIAIRKAGVGTFETLFFGDQIFTDVIGSNLAGIDCVLVDPVEFKSEPPHISLKRVFEWPIKKWYFACKNLK